MICFYHGEVWVVGVRKPMNIFIPSQQIISIHQDDLLNSKVGIPFGSQSIIIMNCQLLFSPQK